MKHSSHPVTFNIGIYLSIFAVTQITGLLLSISISFVLQDFIGGFIKASMTNSFIVGCGLIGSCVLFQRLLSRIKTGWAVLVSFFLLLGIAIISLLILLYTTPTMFIYYNRGLLAFLFINFLFILSLFTITTGLITYREILLRKEQAINLEQSLKNRMEMQLLTSKVNPHFLFNTLSMILNLLKKPRQAEEAILNLSDLLRFTLEQSEKQTVPVSQEIDHAEKYLSLQKMRFGDRLAFSVNCDVSFRLPPLLLQPLIENSIKHNIKEADHLDVDITITAGENIAEITVTDSAKKVHPDMLGTGQGLTLTKKRVENAGGIFSIEKGGIRISLNR